MRSLVGVDLRPRVEDLLRGTAPPGPRTRRRRRRSRSSRLPPGCSTDACPSAGPGEDPVRWPRQHDRPRDDEGPLGVGGGQHRIRGEDRQRLAGLGAVVAAASRRRRTGAPNVVLDRARRRRLRPARLLRLRHRHARHRRPGRRGRAAHQLPHHRAVLADPGLPAHRPQPPPQRHGPRRRPGHRASPATGAGRRARTASSPRSSGPTATPPTPSASGTSPPRTRPTWRARAPPGRSAGASTAGTASTAARRTSSCPALYHDNHACGRPRTVEEGYHLSADLADRAIEFLGRPPRRRRRAAVLPLLRHRRLPLAAPRAGRVDRALPGPLRPGLGPLARRDVRPPARARASSPRAPCSRPGRRGCPAGTASTSASGRSPSASWSASPRSSPTPTSRSAGCSTSSTSSGDADNTVVIVVSDNGASSEGGTDGTINEGRLSNFEGAGVDEMYRRIDEIGGPRSHNNYPWGWTMAGNTPFKRWKREVHEGGVADPCIVRLPRGRRGRRRRRAPAVRPRHRRPADRARAGRHRGAGRDRRHRPVAPRRHELRLRPRRRRERAPERHPTQYFEMLGSRAIYHDGWKAVTFHPVGPLYDDGLGRTRPFDDDVWELYHVAEDVSEVARPGRRVPREGGRARRAVVGGGAAQRRAPARQPRPRGHGAQARPPPLPGRLPLLPGRRPVPESVAVDVRNRSHAITVDLEVPDGAVPDGVLLALGSALGGWSLHVLDGRLRYVHNLYGQTHYEVGRRRRARAGSPHGRVPLRQGPGRWRHGRARSSTATPWARPRSRRFTPVAFNEVGIGLTCGYEWGPPVGDGYAAPFPFNGTIVRAEVTATGPVVHDPVAEIAAILLPSSDQWGVLAVLTPPPRHRELLPGMRRAAGCGKSSDTCPPVSGVPEVLPTSSPRRHPLGPARCGGPARRSDGDEPSGLRQPACRQ